jgi:formylglycine-generating enzyme required for sulfatase activity
MAGSVSEFTVDRPSARYRYRSVRGANWFNTDVDYDRAASRNGRMPEGTGTNTGFRLVIELGEPSTAPGDVEED